MSINLRDGFVDESLERVLEDLLVRFVVNCPDEDLSSIERVLFQIEEAQWFYQDFARVLNTLLPPLKMKQFTSKIIAQCPLVWQWGDPREELSKFGKYKSSIPVRGCALLNENLDKLLLVKGVESPTWSFPRGKISKDESDVDCALRELDEETGFDAHDFIDEDEYIERTIMGKNYKIYIITGVPESTVFEPKVRNEIGAIEWKDVKFLTKACKSSNHYYLVGAMIKQLQSFISKAKSLQTEEELKKKATVQLKKILGVGLDDQETKDTQEKLDPGRELLNMLQQVSIARQPSVVAASGDQQPTSVPSIAPPQQLPLPFQGLQGLQLPFPMPLQRQQLPPMLLPGVSPFPLPFFNPFMPPQNFIFPPHFPVPPPPHSSHVGSVNDEQKWASDNLKNELFPPAPSSFSKPQFPLANRRSKEADSKELLSILNSKPAQQIPEPTQPKQKNTNFLRGLFDNYKSPSAEKPPIKILKREKSAEIQSNVGQQRIESLVPEKIDITKPANQSTPEAPETVAPSPNLKEKKVVILKRPQSAQSTASSTNSGAQELLSMLGPNKVHEQSNTSPPPSDSPASSSSQGAELLSILKGPASSSVTKTADTSSEPPIENVTGSNELLSLLSGGAKQAPPTSSAPANGSPGSELLNILRRPVATTSATVPREEATATPVASPQPTDNTRSVLLDILHKKQEPADPTKGMLDLLVGQDKPAENGSLPAASSAAGQLLNVLNQSDASNSTSNSQQASKELLSVLHSGGARNGFPASPAPNPASSTGANDLLALLKGKPTAEPVSKPNESAELLSLLHQHQPVAKTTPPAPEPTLASAFSASNGTNELMSLLKNGSIQSETPAVDGEDDIEFEDFDDLNEGFDDYTATHHLKPYVEADEEEYY